MDTDSSQIGSATEAEDAKYPHRQLTEQMIGAAFEVHRELGPGFLEKVYETALIRELRGRDVSVAAQVPMDVLYKGQPIGTYYCDLLVDKSVICEIKASSGLTTEHEAQLLNYLKGTGTKVGLLLNFGTRKLQVKRLVF
ncbi:MAG: GxxExxY protein [Dehalococcoidia bacterium]